ncbi:serine/threonine kinase [Aureococcus anophagefferens]|nr:serine/threonine kinase [Aureococcus anophagefferens]
MQALFDNKKAPQNSALESTWSSQPELPPVVEDLQVTATVGKYAVSRKLGEGEFATVFACRAGDDDGAPELALKVINKAKVQRHSSILKSKRNIRRVNMEVLAMRRCRHAGICRIYDVLHSPSSVYLVMEMAGRDLFTFLDGYPDGCPEPIIKQVMRILAVGLRHCHNAGVAHRDVKPENILVVGEPHEWDEASETKGIVKICDFGLCADIEVSSKLTDFVGSPGFFAPELMMRQRYDGPLADAWSMGAVMVEMFLGHRVFETIWCPPYESLSDVAAFSCGIAEAVARVKLGTAKSVPSEPVRKMFELLLQIEPERRSSVDVVCKSSWFELLKLSEDGKYQLLRLTIDGGGAALPLGAAPPPPERRRRVGGRSSLRAAAGPSAELPETDAPGTAAPPSPVEVAVEVVDDAKVDAPLPAIVTPAKDEPPVVTVANANVDWI